MKVETKQYRGYDINIYLDEEPESPREWENLGTMVAWHQRYDLGDKHDFEDSTNFRKWAKENKAFYLPLYLFEHGGLSISASGFSYCDPDGWDWGQIGWIYITEEKIRNEFNWKKLTAKRMEQIESYLLNEVEIYNNYLNGNVYGYIIERNEKSFDSCWGYYGDPEESGLLEDAKSNIDYYITEERRKHQEKTKALIKNHVPLIYREVRI